MDSILSQASRQTRQNIRRGKREGISVRTGNQEDVDLFFELHLATSKRQNFLPYPREYFKEMWKEFSPTGNIQILIAEYQNKPVSGLLIIPFRDTVLAKLLGWSGEFKEFRPNDILFWESICWSQSHGYKFFDFEGVNPEGAKTYPSR